MKKYLILIFGCVITGNIFCQKHDYNWLFGAVSDDPLRPITGNDTLLWGATNFDFNHDPVRIYRDKNRYTDFIETNA